jgi:hypothetical protein
MKAYDEAWRTFSWSRHLTLDLPYPHQAPYVSGDTLVLPVHEMEGVIKSFIMQSIPSPLRGVPGRQWRIDFDFFVLLFVMDATQDLFVVLPRHDAKSVSSLSLRLPHVYQLTRPYSIFLFTLSAGQPHPLSANEGVLYLEQSRRPSRGNSKHEIYGEFLGMITVSKDALDDQLFIWNWKTGIIHVKMVPFFVNILDERTLIWIAQPIQVGSGHDAVFSFLDDRHFVVPSVPSERPNKIILNVYRLHHHHYHGQQQDTTPIPVRSYVIPLTDAFTAVSSLRFFPDVSARGGASPGYFYADASKREFGIQIEATSQSTDTVTVHELLVPFRALMAMAPKHTPPPCRRVSVCYEPYLGRRLAYASRLAAECHSKVLAEKLPPALRGVRARQLRFAVCCGALLVFEVSLGGYGIVFLWGMNQCLSHCSRIIACQRGPQVAEETTYLCLLRYGNASRYRTSVIFTAVTTLFHANVPEMVGGILLWVHFTIRVKRVEVRSVNNPASVTLCTRTTHMLGTHTRSIHDSIFCWIKNQSDLNERLE